MCRTSSSVASESTSLKQLLMPTHRRVASTWNHQICQLWGAEMLSLVQRQSIGEPGVQRLPGVHVHPQISLVFFLLMFTWHWLASETRLLTIDWMWLVACLRMSSVAVASSIYLCVRSPAVIPSTIKMTSVNGPRKEPWDIPESDSTAPIFTRWCYISQGNVTVRLRCGGIFNDDCIEFLNNNYCNDDSHAENRTVIRPTASLYDGDQCTVSDVFTWNVFVRSSVFSGLAVLGDNRAT